MQDLHLADYKLLKFGETILPWWSVIIGHPTFLQFG